MFQMRAAHREAFAHAAISDFIDRAIAYLKQEVPERMKALPPADQEAFVRRAMNNKWGLTSERAMLYLAQLRLMLGEDFAARPNWQWAVDVLTDSTRDPSERAEWVVTMVAQSRPN